MTRSTIMVVDDEPTQLRLIQHVLETKLGYKTIAFSSGKEAVEYIASYRNPQPDAILLDLCMPEMDGMDVINAIRPKFPHLPIIVLTIYGNIEKAVAAIKAGATDFLSKPVAHERLRTSIDNALRINQLACEVQRLQRTHQGGAMFEDIVGESHALDKVKKHAIRASESLIPVILEGESGSGKELFARAIHGASERAAKPFVAVNCGALPEELIEPVLFGHEKGVLQGADYRSLGKIKEASGGTLFLDEVSELPSNVQMKLLRVLQDNAVTPIGSEKSAPVDIRIITASNRDLHELVLEGFFREDLFYRLNVMPISIPPLRERKSDVSALALHFLKRFSALEGKPCPTFSDEAMQLLEQHPWPGNIRQLENTLYRLAALHDEELIEIEHVRDLLPATIHGFAAHETGRNTLVKSRKLALLNGNGELRRMRDIEQDIIYFALRFYDGRISEVARRLGIGRSTLYRKMHDYDIEAA